MARHAYLVFTALVVCLGCRILPTADPDRDSGAPASAPGGDPPVPPPDGAWALKRDDGGRVELDIEEGLLRFVARLNDGNRISCEGRFDPPRPGMLTGVMTRTDLEGPNVKMSTVRSLPFELHYALEGEWLEVTRLEGGGWDAASAELFRGRYRLTAARPFSPREPKPDTGPTEGKPE